MGEGKTTAVQVLQDLVHFGMIEATPDQQGIQQTISKTRVIIASTTPEGDAISRGAEEIAVWALDQYEGAIRSDYEGTSAFHPMLAEVSEMRAALRSLPPQDDDKFLRAYPAAVQAGRWEEVARLLSSKCRALEKKAAAANARAEKAEARAVELEAENERIGDLFDDLCHFTTPEQRRAYLTGGPAALSAQPVAQEPVEGIPERIWADPDNLTWVEADPNEVMRKDEVCYIRADLAHPATPAPVEAGKMADLIERLEHGVVCAGLHDDNMTELYLIDDATDAMAEAAAALRAQSAPVVPVTHPPMSQAALDVLAERQRQISAEGWTREHDDQHVNGNMALAAATYAVASTYPETALLYVTRPYHINNIRRIADLWPWESDWWKPAPARRMLEKAGALILAEMERLDRLTPPSALDNGEGS